MNAITSITPDNKLYSEADSYVTALLEGAKECAAKDAEKAVQFRRSSPIQLSSEADRIKKIMTTLDHALRIAANDLIDIHGYVSADVAETLINYQSDMMSDMAHGVGPILAPPPN